ncbi:hypothetical protein, partial [Paraburkholderia sediminicola]
SRKGQRRRHTDKKAPRRQKNQAKPNATGKQPNKRRAGKKTTITPHPSKIAKKYQMYPRPIKRESGGHGSENVKFNRATTHHSPPPPCGTSPPAMSAFQHAATILSFSIDCALWVSNNSLN